MVKHGQVERGLPVICGIGGGNRPANIPPSRKTNKVESVTCERCLRVIAASLEVK